MTARQRISTVLGILIASIAGASYMVHAAPDNAAPAADKALDALLAARLEAAEKCLEASQAAFDAETIIVSDLVDAMAKLHEAEMALAATPHQKIEALKKQVERLSVLEAKLKGLLGVRGGEAEKYHGVQRERLTAQINLHKAQPKARS